MQVDELLDRAKEAFSAGRVFGEPVRHDGVTVIPVALVVGGGGGGAGTDGTGEQGGGGGFGLRARAAGAYVIDGDTVTWQPALDVNGLVASLVQLAVAILLFRWRMAAIRARREAATDHA